MALLVASADGSRSEAVLVGRSDNLVEGIPVDFAADLGLTLDRIRRVGRPPENTDGVAALALACLGLARFFVFGDFKAGRDPAVAADAGRQADCLALSLTFGDLAGFAVTAMMVALTLRTVSHIVRVRRNVVEWLRRGGDGVGFPRTVICSK